MKNFNLCAILAIGIMCMQPTDTYGQASQQSLFAYVYKQIVPQSSSMAIPAAKDAAKKVIIFDVNGVLCTTNKLRAAQIIGADVISAYILEQLKFPTSIDLFKALQEIPAISTMHAFNDEIALPQIMVDWKAGIQDTRDIQDAMMTHIAASNLTTAEKNLYTQIVLMITTPAQLIATKQIIIEGLQLARTLKKLGYKLYVLSNWDAASFQLFVKKFPELFTYEDQDLFDGIMIAGQQHCLKPDQKIYQAYLKKFNIDPAQAIFIDDSLKNIQTAQKLGIDSIHCQHNNIAQVKKELITTLTQQTSKEIL
jgi:FMN phosphatase YigB (HAD superfamily)